MTINVNIQNIIITNNQLFEYIKNEKWDLLIEFINDDKNLNFNYNIQNANNIYLLEFLVLHNKFNIVKLLTNKLINFNIIDEHSKTLFYTIIKYSMDELLDIFIDKNKDNIGFDLFESIDDNGNIPLFYCIKFNNIKAFIKILNVMENRYIKNFNGYNCIHLCIIHNNFKFLSIINKNKKINFNVQTNEGETPLHLSIRHKNYEIFNFLINNNVDFNITENKFNYSILHYIMVYNDFKFIKLLANNIDKINGNIQDICGNIFYHYFINNIKKGKNIDDINDILVKIKFDVNLQNIDGDICIHTLFKNEIINEDILKFLIKNSYLNIQNNNGNNGLFLLVKNNYWINYREILCFKKLDVFIFNNKNEMIFDYINNNDFENFMDILTESYLNGIKSNVNYYDYLDNRCKNKSITLTTEEKKIIKNNFIDKKSDCYILIYNKLKMNIQKFIKERTIQITFYSYPVKHIYAKIIPNYNNILISTYTTSTINIFFGLLYISKTNKNVITSLKLLNPEKKLVKCEKYCEISNFQLLWKNFILINTFDLKLIIDNLLKNNTQFFVIPIGIELKTNESYQGHSNCLIFDLFNFEVERFEPYGKDSPFSYDYDAELLDIMLLNLTKSINSKFNYIAPKKYLTKIGFQLREINEYKTDFIGDPNGFCSLWCLFWINMRIMHPTIERQKLFFLLNKEIINYKLSYKKIIRNYGKNITDLRDNIFNNVGININDWTNDELNFEQVNKLNELLLLELKN